MDRKTLALETIAELKKLGADECDVVVSESRHFDVSVRMGQIEKLEESNSRGMGLRVFKNQASAICHTTDFSWNSIKELAKRAMEIVAVSSRDEFNGLAPKDRLGIFAGELELIDESIASIPTEKKLAYAIELEQAGFDLDKRITNSEGASWGDEIGHSVLATSDGFVGEKHGTSAGASASLLAEQDGVRYSDYWYEMHRFASALPKAKEIGEKAAQRALRKIAGRKIKTGTFPVVLDPLIARRFVSLLFSASSGRAIYKKASFLYEKMGQQIASDSLTIVDDPHLIRGISSKAYDGEGVLTSSQKLVDNGRLMFYPCDSYAAKKLAMRVTGHASRGYAGSPGVGHSNLIVEAGKYSPDEIIKSVKSGLYVTDLFGHGVNMVTGDFSQGAAGIWIENGELTFPVQEITLAGNILEFMQKIRMIGNDLSFSQGSVVAPTMLVESAVIGGE